MTGQDINETRKRAQAYSGEKTFTYIKEVMPNGRENFYNGFIAKVHDDMIIFFDVILKKEFPILLDCIDVIEPSRREIDVKTINKLRGNIYKNA